MYVVTFYSFKGGVGRTMSLVNVAAQIAQDGKRVLIVDFDLEAPGIPTFNIFSGSQSKNGIVDYILQYRKTKLAPEVRNFIYSAKKFNSGGELFVMPAGLNDVGYSSRLNSIDWASLYANEDGYLFFEDLKQQWQDTIAPDYVLIDSRTGHSDVEGICTRQLPDAVCFLFFPNEQNLEGLRRVVHNVKVELATRLTAGKKNPLALHFVVSNVPDLDDEHGIIGATLNRFKDQLGYEALAGQVHHYDSLSLLNQEIFSESRPKSRLAREYREVAQAIVSANLSDRDVALAFVEKTARELRTPTAGAQYSIPIEKVEDIMAAFPADMEISIQVALIYETIGRFADALSLLTDLSGNQSSYSYAIRARLHHRVGQRDRAAEDLRRMLQAPSVEVASLLEALSIAPQVAPDIFVGLADSPALLSLAPAQRVFVALQLDDGEEELPAKAAILESALDNESEPDPIVAHQLALVSIGIRRFERAVLLLEPKPGKPRKLEIADTFNLAMAKLGLTGVPERHLFETVVNLETGRSKTDNSANYAFCLAIANAAIGHNAEAREWLELSRATISAHPRREFSPWTYAKVPAAKFKQQLSELEHQMNLGVLTPAFSNGQQDLLA